jgi:methyl-accepting chemotaxis protein
MGMPQGSNGERLDRLEAIVQILAEDQQSLTRIVADLATQTRKGFEQSDLRTTRLEEQMRQTDERMRQTDERMRQTDARIDKLVSAIGEFIKRSS